MRVGIITGSGTYALPSLSDAVSEEAITPFGACLLTKGTLAGVEVVHVSRHGAGHARLSSHVNHRANLLALRDRGAEAILAVTVCGAVDPTIELGSLIVFDDLHFLANRLPGGELCSVFAAGQPGRGHWVFESPFSPPLRRALLEGAAGGDPARPVRDGGCYGHVDGPRFNTRAEISMLAGCGVSAVSQTAGPETVLAGELELPFALLGYATDYANGVMPEPTPVAELIGLIAASTESFAAVIPAAGARLDGAAPAPTGTVLRFD
ncbi:MAG TPA: MTAP family purine nucleoside phosphorylase [Solirubrobacteraceae bacterium]|jgi:purine nucleoside phosphorylase|nr:MTAP family purine nucleoside phosphorylase [Solirubrobacteraceae bacterium]